MDLFEGKKILLISPEKWGPVRLSKHHYASSLARSGARVHFLDPPDPAVKDIIVSPSDEAGLFIVQRRPDAKGLRFSPRQLQQKHDARLFQHIQRSADVLFDIIWNFDPFQFRYLVNDLAGPLRVLHLMDHPWNLDLSSQARNADVVFAVTKGILEIARMHQPNSHLIGHALALREDSHSIPVQHVPRPYLGYIGNLAIRSLHWPSLTRIAKDFPQAQLFLIGPTGAGALGGERLEDRKFWKELSSRPNVHAIGPVAWTAVTAWSRMMDVLLIAYDDERFPGQVANSHKLMEYLHAGPVVLSSHLEDATDVAHLIHMMPPGVGIAEGLGHVLDRLDELNSSASKEARMAFAAARTYDKSLERIAAILFGDQDQEHG